MRITAGSFKGRSIPFHSKKPHGAEVTPSMVKEALFSILGEDMSGMRMLDLYACSGQIALEALSRGADFVVFNDSDPKRAGFIKELAGKWGISSKAMVLGMKASRCLRFLETGKRLFDIVFVDPPYVKKEEKIGKYEKILREITGRDILTGEWYIVVQHFSSNEMPSSAGRASLVKTYRYGNTSLSLYGRGE